MDENTKRVMEKKKERKKERLRERNKWRKKYERRGNIEVSKANSILVDSRESRAIASLRAALDNRHSHR